jgi:hypothetical protein
MLQKLKSIFETFRKIPSQNRLILKQTESVKMLQGQVLSALNNQNKEAILKNIQAAEFSIFSQWGDDGIINFLSEYLDFEHQTFLEFGVEDYSEANTDGNDYHIWKAITCVNPTLVVMEYNSIFGSNQPWTIPYEADFVRQNKHYSHLYCGCSILSYCDLAEEKGYAFIGSNRAGNNAYFVRNDKLKQLPTLTAEQGYVESKFRESRNQEGQLTFIGGTDRLKLLNGLEILNTRTNLIEKINVL